MIEIYSFRIINDIPKQLFNKLLAYLTIDSQARINRFTNFDDAQRGMFADIIKRLIICKKLKITNNHLSFYKNKYGKPFLKTSDLIHFNISHSGDWVVFAFDSKKIGIDVEVIKPIDFSIARRFFSKEEVDSLFNIQKKSYRLSRFYDLWTLKESYIKAEGKGLSIPLDSFSMNIHDDIEVKNKTRNINYFFKQYNIDDNYKLSVCASNNTFPESITCINIENIISDIDRYFIEE